MKRKSNVRDSPSRSKSASIASASSSTSNSRQTTFDDFSRFKGTQAPTAKRNYECLFCHRLFQEGQERELNIHVGACLDKLDAPNAVESNVSTEDGDVQARLGDDAEDAVVRADDCVVNIKTESSFQQVHSPAEVDNLETVPSVSIRLSETIRLSEKAEPDEATSSVVVVKSEHQNIDTAISAARVDVRNTCNMSASASVKDEDEYDDIDVSWLESVAVDDTGVVYTTALKDTSVPPGVPDDRTAHIPRQKLVPTTTWLVDGFRYARQGLTFCFLTHYHSDHYGGLSSTFQGTIVCTRVTANLVAEMLRVNRQCLQVIETDQWDLISNGEYSMWVYALDANHCPGAVMFLFQERDSDTFHLHTGDARFLPMHVEKIVNVVRARAPNGQLETVFLDTTYYRTRTIFPSQQSVAETMKEMIRVLLYEDSSPVKGLKEALAASRKDGDGGVLSKWLRPSERPVATQSPRRFLFLLETYTIGKERIALSLAAALQTPIYAEPRKCRILELLEGFHLDIASFPTESSVHLIPSRSNVETYISKHALYKLFTDFIAIEATGWTSPMKATGPDWTKIPEFGLRDVRATHSTVFFDKVGYPLSRLRVPYSEHSSFAELGAFVLGLVRSGIVRDDVEGRCVKVLRVAMHYIYFLRKLRFAKMAATSKVNSKIRWNYRMDSQPLPEPEHELYQEGPELPEAYIKYDTDENLPRVYYAGKRLLPTCSSSYFLQLSKTWDQGSKSVRVKILEEFVRCNQDKTGPQLEREFSNGASLFLTRITAWLRLTYLLGQHLTLQIRAINIFVSASSGHRFLAEFLEVGGVLTVLEILGLAQVKEGDKAEALILLASVAHAGRKYKEFICESYGVRAIADCLARSKSEVTQDHARHLLYQLGIGNPKFLMQVYKSLLSLLTAQGAGPTPQQMAGQALRMLLPSIQAIHPSIVEATIALLKSPHIQIQYEGYEILRELITRPPLQEAILSQLILILRTSIEDIQDDAPDERRRRQRTGDGKTFGGQWGGGLVPKSEDKAFNDSITSGYIQQAYAAKLLGLIAATKRELAERMIDMQIVSGLLNVISNVGNPDSQQYAASALIYFVETFQFVAQALKEHMGQNFFDLLEDKPDTFFRELTREQVRYLRRNAVIIRGAGSQASLSDWDDNYDTDEERERTAAEAPRPKSARSQASSRSKSTINSAFEQFPSTRDADSEKLDTKPTEEKTPGPEAEAKPAAPVVPEETFEIQPSTEPPASQDIYIPFAQSHVNATFSSNKSATSNAEAKKDLQTELAELRKTAMQPQQKGPVRQEFQLDASTEQWLAQKKNVDFSDVKQDEQASSSSGEQTLNT
ncbi:hypothetical protein HDU85_004651 [Gaertneriomyces sp. JEL0708]|nr:hypothetical protein HDU85_004651 [Gaertneriomyces sp. JEL0708]